jgi:hypothetical protein
MDKLLSLINEEDRIHARSKDAAERDPQLQDLLQLVEIHVDLMFLVAARPFTEEDPKALSALSARVFNTMASARRLAFCGYYQAAFATMRDFLEVATLLNAFRHYPEKLGTWRSAKKGAVPEELKPIRLRKAIEERDPDTAKALQDLYGLYSHHATHPTYDSLRVLQRQGVSVPGPHFSEAHLRNVLVDLARLLVLSAGPIFQFLAAAKSDVAVPSDVESLVNQARELAMQTGLAVPRSPAS